MLRRGLAWSGLSWCTQAQGETSKSQDALWTRESSKLPWPCLVTWKVTLGYHNHRAHTAIMSINPISAVIVQFVAWVLFHYTNCDTTNKTRKLLNKCSRFDIIRVYVTWHSMMSLVCSGCSTPWTKSRQFLWCLVMRFDFSNHSWRKPCVYVSMNKVLVGHVYNQTMHLYYIMGSYSDCDVTVGRLV